MFKGPKWILSTLMQPLLGLQGIRLRLWEETKD
jgi:hypothetical protein